MCIYKGHASNKVGSLVSNSETEQESERLNLLFLPHTAIRYTETGNWGWLIVHKAMGMAG